MSPTSAGRKRPHAVSSQGLPGDPVAVPKPAGTPRGSSFSQVELGQRLRDARKKARLTLQQLSRSSGYSITHLSQVERGHACPTIGALRKISASLGRDMRVFLEPSLLPDVPLVRREERPRADLTPPHFSAEFLAAQIPGGELYAALLRIAPFGPKEQPAPVLAEGSRFVYVLKGRLEITYEGVTHLFGAGDAYYFMAGVKRHYRNLDREPCELLVVSLAPVT